jgi:hypothetical protein
VLLVGPLKVDEARQVNFAVNRVLRGLRVRQGGVPTGAAARVLKNIGPAASKDDPDQGPESGPDTTSDMG